MDAKNCTSDVNEALRHGFKEDAIRILVGLAQSGHVGAIKDLSDDNFLIGRDDLVVEWTTKFEALLQARHPHALLIRSRENGSLGRFDIALQLLREAAEAGFSEAQLELADAYRNGELGLARSEVRSRLWREQARVRAQVGAELIEKTDTDMS
ncbi:hypothetical protein [Caenimonas sp. SL110]|uniref:hypothetical protein n=1 Tax=Caenimonas sp. SL110 TaxID=1450524 RepID=UPI00128BEB85|nr:hypothetical protein [Caenimonas sp. SL110]